MSKKPTPVLAAGLLDEGSELLVNDLPQLDFVPVLFIKTDPTEHPLVVCLLQLVEKDKCSGRWYPTVLITFSIFAKICKICCPVPRDKQVQQLSENTNSITNNVNLYESYKTVHVLYIVNFNVLTSDQKNT